MSAKILAAVDDIFFAAKIRATAESLGIAVAFPRDASAFEQAVRTDAPALVIVDLQASKHDPFALVGRLKSDERLSGVPVVGFFSHVETELQSRAEAAGFDQVMPRSLFTRRLPDILQGSL